MNNKTKKILFVTAFLCFIIIAILSSPLFSIENISIKGNKNVPIETILQEGNIKKGNNLFSFSISKFKKALSNNAYIEDISVEKKYFAKTLIINIKEREIKGYVSFTENQYLYIDKDGRVLDVKSSFTEKKPIIVGLNFSKFNVGEILNVKNETTFNIVVALSRIFTKYDINSEIIRIDVSDEQNIHFYYGKIDIQIGSITDIDKKVRIIKTILPQLEKNKDIGGYLDIKNVDGYWPFKILT